MSAGVIAGVLLALGFALSAALAFICKSWLFQLETLSMYVHGTNLRIIVGQF